MGAAGDPVEIALDVQPGAIFPGVVESTSMGIDVDGAEPAILRGGRAVLERDRPTIILELAPYALERLGSSLDDYLALLRNAGYALSRETDGSALPEAAEALARLIPPNGSINAIARAN